MVINVLCVNWYINVVIFFLEGCEGRHDLAFFIRLQECSLWGKFDFIFVFVWHFPLVLERDSGLVFDQNGLLGGDSSVHGREKQLLVVRQLQLWLIAVANEVNFVNV